MKQLPKMLSLLCLAALSLPLLTGCGEEEIGVRQPTINLEDEQWVEDSLTVETGDESVTEEPGLKLPSQDELISGSVSASSDLAMTLVARFLSFDASDSPQGTVNDIRPLVSTPLLEKIGAVLRERDWEAIQSGELNQIAEVSRVEIVEYRQEVPRVVRVEVSLYEYSENADEEQDSLGTETWWVTVEPNGLSNQMIAIDLEQR